MGDIKLQGREDSSIYKSLTVCSTYASIVAAIQAPHLVDQVGDLLALPHQAEVSNVFGF